MNSRAINRLSATAGLSGSSDELHLPASGLPFLNGNGGQPLVHVVILNWNGWRDTLHCVHSLRRMNYRHWHAVVVDNGSTDDSVEQLRAACPEATILLSETNLGFAAGNNIGIRFALRHGADYVLVLNNDTIVGPGALNELSQFAESHPHAALMGPRIERHNPGRDWPIRRKMDLTTLLCTLTFLRRLIVHLPIVRGLFYSTDGLPSPVHFLSGSALFFRASSFEKIGLFDERTFLDYEELIMAEKVRTAGLSAYFVPQATIWHKGSASCAKLRAKRYIENAKSEEYFFTHYVRLSRFGRALLKSIRFFTYGARALRYRNYREHFNEFMQALRQSPPDRPEPRRLDGMRSFLRQALRTLLSKTFPLWQTLGIHVTPNYFESPIPDTRSLNSATWTRTPSLTGIDLREPEQIKLLEAFMRAYRANYERFPRSRTNSPYEYYVDNGFFEAVDGEILYCMIRHFKPKRIYEVGCGHSTLLAAQALIENEKDGATQGQLVAFEPFPNSNLRRGFPGLTRLVVSKVEEVGVSVFQELQANDILFLDSSHVVRIGGDVQREFLEILPNLNPGVIVHIHDIFLPAEYPRKLITGQHRFFSEQYLLQAFLAFNQEFEVLWAGSFMHLTHPDLLEQAFNSYQRGSRWPGSFWIRRAKSPLAHPDTLLAQS